jgi:hypothetical protein
LAKDGFGKVYEGYSGRDMYGETCLGIDTNDPNTLIEEATIRGVRGAVKDQLGKGYIIYWPHIKG